MNHKIIYLVFTSILLLWGCETNDFSSEQTKHFIKFFGSYSLDYGKDVIADDDGYILVGSRATPNKGREVLVIKTDEYGNTVWEKTYGGNLDDEGNCIRSVAGNGYIILGSKTDSTNKTDVLLLKIASDGTLEWEKSIDNTNNETGKMLKVLDNRYLILGNSDASNPGTNNPQGSQDIILISTDLSGNVIWKSTFGGNGNDVGNDLLVLKNSFLIIGSSNSFQGNGQQNTNIIVLKTSTSGGLIDMAIHGGAENDFGLGVCAHKDGIVICGTTNSFAESGTDMYVARLEDDLRTASWTMVYGQQGNDDGMDVLFHNNEIIAAGNNEITGGTAGMLVKINEEGTFLSESSFGGIGVQSFNAVKSAPDGGFILVGSSNFEQNSMIVLTKTSNNGKLTQ